MVCAVTLSTTSNHGRKAMINIHSIQDIKPMAKTYPVGGYQSIKEQMTAQLREEVYGHLSTTRKTDLRLNKNERIIRGGRKRIPFGGIGGASNRRTRNINANTSYYGRLSRATRDSIELGAIAFLAILVTLTAFSWVM